MAWFVFTVCAADEDDPDESYGVFDASDAEEEEEVSDALELRGFPNGRCTAPLAMAPQRYGYDLWHHCLLNAAWHLAPLQPPPAAAFPADFSRGTVEALLAGIVDASE